MQLYSSAFSPYAARCRIQIYHKALPIDIVPPPGGLGSETLRAKNANGKIPMLDLDDGRTLAESWSIMEYLEETQPQNAMRPRDAFARAQLSMLVRFIDIYLAPAMFPLFRALRGAGDADTIGAALEAMRGQIAILERLLLETGRCGRAQLDLADCALIPVLWYALLLSRHFGGSDVLAAAPTTRDWWHWAKTQPAAARVLDEMESGLRRAIPVLFEH